MKRIFLLFMTLPLFLLSACGEPPTVESDCRLAFTAENAELPYAGTVEKNGDTLTVTMSEPYTVQDMAFTYEDSALSINYGGHSTQSSADYLPTDSVPAMLYSTLSYLPQAAYSGTQDGADRFILPTPYGDSELTARDGIPVSLTVPKSALTFSFEPIG
nr:hypothetical protein [uncultured Ruminococcus sp.]